VNKVLVCYVNPFDATAQIAMTVAEQLCRHGYHVDLRPVHRVGSVRHYCGAVIGGALSATEWDLGAVQLLHRCIRDNPRALWIFHTWFGSGRPSLGDQWPAAVAQVANRVDSDVVVLGDDGPAPARQWASMIARHLDADLAPSTAGSGPMSGQTPKRS
jgi:hypothetical protein